MTWLLQFVPWWAWVTLAVLIIGAVQALFGWKAAIGATVPVLAALGLGWARNEGAKAERAKRDAEALDHVRVRQETDDEVEQLAPDAVKDRLAQWNRGDEQG